MAGNLDDFQHALYQWSTANSLPAFALPITKSELTKSRFALHLARS
jgi:hypothetical protein